MFSSFNLSMSTEDDGTILPINNENKKKLDKKKC